MITFDFQNMLSVLRMESVQDCALQEESIQLLQNRFMSRNQRFYAALDEDALLVQMESFVDSLSDMYTDIVLLGIGGSALGPKTIRDALGSKNNRRLHVYENIDPDFVCRHSETFDLENTLFLVVSKSGKTTETLAQYFYFLERIQQTNRNPQHHFVFITEEGSLLHEESQRYNAPFFPIAKDIGGRFSVFTPVGILPALLLGIDVQSFLQGAKDMRVSFFEHSWEQNIPAQVAQIQFLSLMKKRTKNVFMPYIHSLRTFSDWFVQLVAESTGKTNENGEKVGITPIPALGATDQHSQLQLFSEGPRDVYVFFVKSKTAYKADPFVVPEHFRSEYSFLNGISFHTLLNTQHQATSDSLVESGCGNATFVLDCLDAYHLGALFFLFLGSTAYVGELMDIDAFNQPGVERSKVLTRQYLSA